MSFSHRQTLIIVEQKNICRQSTSVLVLIQEKKRCVFFVFDNLIKYSKMNEALIFVTNHYEFFLLFFFKNRRIRMNLIILKRISYVFINKIYIDKLEYFLKFIFYWILSHNNIESYLFSFFIFLTLINI